VEIGAEKKVVETNTLVESNKNRLHCWNNESDEELTFIVIKSPGLARETEFMS
jgi:mannose-6-phosphate isomerase-like protein (cupin superfamily)